MGECLLCDHVFFCFGFFSYEDVNFRLVECDLSSVFALCFFFEFIIAAVGKLD